MAMSQTQVVTGTSPRAIAPAWHTAIVILIMLGYSILGSRTGNLAGVPAHGRVGGYVLAIIFELAAAGFVWYGVRRRGIRLAELVGGKWLRPIAVLRDFALAVGFLLIATPVLSGLGYLLKAAPNQAVRNIYPQGPVEIIVYLLLVLTAGFCEELIFRGYLQRQFAALTHAAAGGIVLQGIVFGASHGYQGWKYMLVISVFGVMFGLLAHWRRSLRPGIIAHVLQDGLGGILGRYLH
jgi:uncharacterized protein